MFNFCHNIFPSITIPIATIETPMYCSGNINAIRIRAMSALGSTTEVRAAMAASAATGEWMMGNSTLAESPRAANPPAG